MPYLRDAAYVLKSEPYREHDVRVTLYGREHGKLEAVARGVRRWGAKHRGHLEPLTKVDVMIANGAAIDKLAVSHVSVAQTNVRGQLGAMTTLGCFANLVDQLTRPGLADVGVFDLLEELSATWSGAVREPSVERARFVFAVSAYRLLSCLGYASPLTYTEGLGETNKLLHILPGMPFSFALSVVAPVSALNEASSIVAQALERTPLAERAHGFATISAIIHDF